MIVRISYGIDEIASSVTKVVDALSALPAPESIAQFEGPNDQYSRDFHRELIMTAAQLAAASRLIATDLQSLQEAISENGQALVAQDASVEGDLTVLTSFIDSAAPQTALTGAPGTSSSSAPSAAPATPAVPRTPGTSTIS